MLEPVLIQNVDQCIGIENQKKKRKLKKMPTHYFVSLEKRRAKDKHPEKKLKKPLPFKVHGLIHRVEDSNPPRLAQILFNTGPYDTGEKALRVIRGYLKNHWKPGRTVTYCKDILYVYGKIIENEFSKFTVYTPPKSVV